MVIAVLLASCSLVVASGLTAPVSETVGEAAARRGAGAPSIQVAIDVANVTHRPNPLSLHPALSGVCFFLSVSLGMTLLSKVFGGFCLSKPS